MFAAASLKNALDDTNAAFTKATGIKVTASYEASSALAKQIEQGAPADVFISADLRWMDYAAEHKLIKPDTRFNLLGNRLVLIAPKDSKLDNVDDRPRASIIAKLAGDGRIAVADVKAVPAGQYAKAALEKLGAWAAAEPKLAQAENVRATLAFVARGETPVGIVYETDAKIEPKVKIVGVFPDGSYPPVTYPVAATADEQERRRRALSGLPARQRGQGDFRKIRLQLPDQAGVVSRVLDLTAAGLDRGRAVAAHRARGDGGVAAVRHRHRHAAGAQGVLGQGAGRRRRLSAAGVAAGGDRLSAAHHARPARRRSAPSWPIISASCSRSAGPAP